MPAMDGLLKVGYTPDQFDIYVVNDLAHKMLAWRPSMIVDHNTGKMVWPGFDVHNNPITPQQRIENMSVDWVSRGFHGGPHLLISPDGMIYTVWPLWLSGTHSPSWNHISWGIEHVGDFDLEVMPAAQRVASLRAKKALYKMLGLPINNSTYKFHLEDSLTAHKHCPGKNFGAKADWLLQMNKLPAPVLVSSIELGHTWPVPPDADNFIRMREGLVLHAYPDTGGFAIGYGTQFKSDGTRVVAGETCTQAQAADWQSHRTLSDWGHIQSNLVNRPGDGLATAFLSFAYEFSVGRLISSTFFAMGKEGKLAEAAAELAKWNHKHDSTGALVEDPGLTRRRNLEIALFYSPSVTPVAIKPVPVLKVASLGVPEGNTQQGEIPMDSTLPKNWWTSQAIWGGLSAVIGGLVTAGVALRTGDIATAAQAIQAVAVSGAGLLSVFGGLNAIIGRWKAKTTIASPSVVKAATKAAVLGVGPAGSAG